MRIVLAAVLFTLSAGLCVQAADKDLSEYKPEYKPMMQAAEGAYDKMEDAIDEKDASAAHQSANELSQHMSRIVEFWTSRGVADAQEYATNVKAAAEEVAAKVDAADFAGAEMAEERAEQNCKSCHEAHRKFSFGGWKIK